MSNPNPNHFNSFPTHKPCKDTGTYQGASEKAALPQQRWNTLEIQISLRKNSVEREDIEKERPHLNSMASMKIILANSSAKFVILRNLICLNLSIPIVKLAIWINI